MSGNLRCFPRHIFPCKAIKNNPARSKMEETLSIVELWVAVEGYRKVKGIDWWDTWLISKNKTKQVFIFD